MVYNHLKKPENTHPAGLDQMTASEANAQAFKN